MTWPSQCSRSYGGNRGLNTSAVVRCRYLSMRHMILSGDSQDSLKASYEDVLWGVFMIPMGVHRQLSKQQPWNVGLDFYSERPDGKVSQKQCYLILQSSGRTLPRSLNEGNIASCSLG